MAPSRPRKEAATAKPPLLFTLSRVRYGRRYEPNGVLCLA